MLSVTNTGFNFINLLVPCYKLIVVDRINIQFKEGFCPLLDLSFH